MIFRDVKEICGKATQECDGDCIEVLIAYVESDNHSFEDKHKATWALGEIGDPRALLVLERLYAGKPCVRPCKYDEYIHQHQLTNSIRLCRGSSVVARPLQYRLGPKK